MGKFSIYATDIKWMDGVDETEDLCLHGHAVVYVGAKKIDFYATISETELYLLKSIAENHIINTDNQLLPCCGFSLFPNDTLDNVTITGCDNGIDWSVIHNGDTVILELEDGTMENIPIEEYKKEVFEFADTVETFYKSSTPKKMPKDKVDYDGYISFWNEWHRRRKQ